MINIVCAIFQSVYTVYMGEPSVKPAVLIYIWDKRPHRFVEQQKEGVSSNITTALVPSKTWIVEDVHT